MSESDFIKNLRTVFVALKEGRDGYLSHSWYQEYPRECDFLVSLGLCKETHPAVGGKRLELADAHAAALASSKPSPASDLQEAHRRGVAEGITSVIHDLEGGLPWAVEWRHENRIMTLAIEADGSFDFTEFTDGKVTYVNQWKPKPSPAFVAMRKALGKILNILNETEPMPDQRGACAFLTKDAKIAIEAHHALDLAEKEAGTTPPAK